MKVCDFMSKNVIYVSPDTSLTDAKALMIKEKINKLPVVDKSKKLVGIITKNDLQKAAPSSASTLDMYELGYLLSKLKVEKIMVKNVKTVDFDEVIEEAARTMATEKIGCLPVMKDGILSGIITETDLFNAFISMFGATLPGVRAVIEVAEKPGELARIATAVAAKNGNIVSVVTADGSDVSKRIITVKIGNLSKETVEEIIRQENVKILDIREKK
ncbi:MULTISPECIES: CBS and ACT domain-containing protein [unclassified Treponema]|uniref:CBS and ACT domain-containing protein n=1 Tax=unclassified Treponema TaxID=2638727 RepID=UPI0025DB9AD2|nr:MULTISPECIES: CBS and ACT domain-containing protein [unclassified Treponema]